MSLSTEFLRFGAALFAIMNPFGAIPIFLSLTADNTPAERRRIGAVAALAVLVALLTTALVGQHVLSFFGISIGAFRTAGGLIILVLALSMLHGRQSSVHHSPVEQQDGEAKDDPAVFPLAIPLIAGPGSIATVILYSGQAPGLAGYVVIGATIALLCLVLGLALRLAAPLSGLLGPTGMNVATRLMGMLLAAIAVEMIAAGMVDLFPALRGGSG
jgi:multiple antibiotic resistance protein